MDDPRTINRGARIVWVQGGSFLLERIEKVCGYVPSDGIDVFRFGIGVGARPSRVRRR